MRDFLRSFLHLFPNWPPIIILLLGLLVCLIAPRMLRGDEKWWEREPYCPMDKCDDAEYGQGGPVARVFRGGYTRGFETSRFSPDGSECTWWLSGDLGSLQAQIDERAPYLFLYASVEVKGTLTPPGCYGHMGAYRRELTVTKVISFKITEIMPDATEPPDETTSTKRTPRPTITDGPLPGDLLRE